MVVGGGHNGLVAAAYLARAGRSVLVLERLAQVGGRRGQPAGVRGRRRPAVRLLLPGQPAARPDRRPTSASRCGWPTARSPPTPPPCATAGPAGLLVERDEGPGDGDVLPRSSPAPTPSSPAGSASTAGWPPWPRTSRPPSPSRCSPPAELAGRLRDPQLWHDLRERPLADVVADHLADDVVRGVALTDGLIGTFADVHAADGLAGRCFLYHLVGNGTGPLAGAGRRHGRGQRRHGGRRAPRRRRAGHPGDGHRAGPARRRRHRALDRRRRHGARRSTPGTSSAARRPTVLAELTGADPGPRPSGSQLKVNMVLARLPRLRSGADPATAFAGTFHVDESAAPDRRRLRAGRGRRGCPTSSRSRSTATR